LKLISDAQCHLSPTRTYKCGRVGLRNGCNGQAITGRLWTSQMSPYSTLLALMGWNGVGGSQETAWTHGLQRRRLSMAMGRLWYYGE